MEFNIVEGTGVSMTDAELFTLLETVYVGGGYAHREEANIIFSPPDVRKRGRILGARCKETNDLVGMVIMVPPDSSARRMAKNNDAEMHLLAVSASYRGVGLGKTLVMAAVNMAKDMQCTAMLLWTQESMHAAQRLYESAGFAQVDTMEKNGRQFLVYRLCLLSHSGKE